MPLRARVLDDVPHDQEIAGELELADDRQLARDLLAYLGQQTVVAGIAARDAEPGHLLEKALLRLAGRHRVAGERVAEIGERERAALGDRARRAQRRRAIREQRRHLGRRFQPALAVGRQAAADLVDGGVGARAGEHVVDPLLRRSGVADVIGGDDTDAVRGRLRLGRARAVRLRRLQVALRFEEDVACAERVDQRRQIRTRRRAGERDQPGRVLGEQRGRCRRNGVLGDSFLHARHQAAKIAVAGAILDEQQQRRRAGQRDLGADDRPHAGLLRGGEEAWRAREPVAIGERQHAVFVARRRCDQILRQRRSVEKAERRSAAQLDVVSLNHSSHPRTSARCANPGAVDTPPRPTRARPSSRARSRRPPPAGATIRRAAGRGRRR